MKSICFCADDYGMSEEVSEAILDLTARGIVHATSCLVTETDWSNHALQLKRAEGLIDIGLHLNFTEGKGLSKAFVKGFSGLLPIMLRSHIRLLDAKVVEQEVLAQFECFIKEFGRPPDFIDGHQHVHHLPVIRHALFKVIKALGVSPVWVRCTTPQMGGSSSYKERVIDFTGGLWMRRNVEYNGARTNASFGGVYNLETNNDFPKRVRFWLESAKDGGLVMCHPACTPAGKIEMASIAHLDARLEEFAYLSSQQFIQDCRDKNVRLARLSSLV